MTHDYTDEEIQTAWKDALSLREFLDALPDRPQAAEIAALKAELAFLRESEFIAPSMQLQRLACEKGNKEAIQEVQKYASTLTVEGINGLLKAIHECLPETQPILADDGRSLEAVFVDAFNAHWQANQKPGGRMAGIQAVAAVVLAQAVRRMEAVPQAEMWKVYKDAPHRIAQTALESVRARLIAAARGEGQAKPVVVNETPQDEKQPDLSGESEKQDPYARMKAYAKAGARIRTHDMEWARDANWTWCLRPESYQVHPDDLHMVPEYDPQAEPTQAQPKPAQPEPAVGDTVRLKSGGPVMTVQSVGHEVCCVWACSGEIQWTKEGGAGNSISAVLATTNLPAACLTPAQP